MLISLTGIENPDPDEVPDIGGKFINDDFIPLTSQFSGRAMPISLTLIKYILSRDSDQISFGNSRKNPEPEPLTS